MPPLISFPLVSLALSSLSPFTVVSSAAQRPYVHPSPLSAFGEGVMREPRKGIDLRMKWRAVLEWGRAGDSRKLKRECRVWRLWREWGICILKHWRPLEWSAGMRNAKRENVSHSRRHNVGKEVIPIWLNTIRSLGMCCIVTPLGTGRGEAYKVKRIHYRGLTPL